MFHFVESVDGRGVFARKRGELHRDYFVRLPQGLHSIDTSCARGRSGLRQAIHGLGGVGKTRLGIEHAWRHASDYTALLFVSACSLVELRANLAALCNPLVYPATSICKANMNESIDSLSRSLTPRSAPL
jgi:hypothetical protein